jgi:co-chaperonin GroES (HSP10)
MNIKPLRDNLIVIKENRDLTTAAGIILQRTDEADKAKVVAIGPDVVDVKEDDLLLVNWNKAQMFDNEHFRINILDVIAVFE